MLLDDAPREVVKHSGDTLQLVVVLALLALGEQGQNLLAIGRIDGVGQRTNILFFDVKMNEALDAKQFTFDVPPGVDVIQE